VESENLNKKEGYLNWRWEYPDIKDSLSEKLLENIKWKRKKNLLKNKTKRTKIV